MKKCTPIHTLNNICKIMVEFKPGILKKETLYIIYHSVLINKILNVDL